MGTDYQIVESDKYDFAEVRKAGLVPGRKGRKRGREYKDLITAFDIETTTLTGFTERPQAVMYVWQWAFGSGIVVMGRTWEQFTSFCQRLIRALDGSTLIVYVHNLSFEFQFLSGIYSFSKDDVFCMDSRKILRAYMWDALEFRCSYIHSNMSLAEYTRKMGVKHAKLSGDDFDYSRIRYPWTPLTAQEVAYCTHDVIGLVEALNADMISTGDTLRTIPLTSTGYVRRDAKNAVIRCNWIRDILPDWDVYRMLRGAFRGGNTHANRYFSGKTVENVTSFDRSSSYPDVQVNCLYPVAGWFHEPEIDLDRVLKLIYKRGRAVLLRVVFRDIHLTDTKWGFPYLSIDKCAIVGKVGKDNGRILYAECVETYITDVDLRIILGEYSFSGMKILDCYHTRYGRQPQDLIDCTIKYYKDKTELKGVEGQEVYYMKQKNKLNSIYGMEATDPGKQTIEYRGGIYQYGNSKRDAYEEGQKRAFLSYAWGVWVTAWARYRLEEGLRLVYEHGGTPLYVDTDSIKYIGDVDWTAYNDARRADSTKNGAFADDPAGNRHYMGVFEHDATYARFKTLGAKKYIDDEGDGHIHVTIAGVTKSKGGAELERAGGFDAFTEGFTFREAGGSDLIYNDDTDLDVTIDGHALHIGKNVVIQQSTYCVGLAGDYRVLLAQMGTQNDIVKALDEQLSLW